MSTPTLVAALAALLVVTVLATVTLLTLLVVVVVQAYRDRRLERALVVSQLHAAAPAGTPTAPNGLLGRMEAWTTGSIPTMEGLRRLEAAASAAGDAVVVTGEVVLPLSDTPGRAETQQIPTV